MKKVLTSLVLTGLLAVPIIGLAQVPRPAGEAPEAPLWGQVDVMRTIDRVSDWLFGALMIVAAIAIIIAGYYFVTATGDPDKTKKARDFVLYALIGVLVGFLAKGLVILVRRIVGI